MEIYVKYDVVLFLASAYVVVASNRRPVVLSTVDAVVTIGDAGFTTDLLDTNTALFKYYAKYVCDEVRID